MRPKAKTYEQDVVKYNSLNFVHQSDENYCLRRCPRAVAGWHRRYLEFGWELPLNWTNDLPKDNSSYVSWISGWLDAKGLKVYQEELHKWYLNKW